MTRRGHNLLLAFTLLGLGSSSVSAWVHYQLLQNPQYTSFCDINTTVSCTEAYLSAYGSLLGTPVAVFGVLWFAAVLALLVVGRPAGNRTAENVPGYIFALSTVGLAVVLYLAYGAFFVLHAVCILCLLTYVAVIGLFLTSAAQTRFPMTTLPERLFRDLRSAAASPLALVAIVVFVLGAASAIAFFPKEVPAVSETPADSQDITPDRRAQIEQWFDAQPRAIVPVGETGGAAVVVVKFNDYQCPPCKSTYTAYKPIWAKYKAEAPGKVLFMTRDFPIDPECNAGTPGGGHALACEAAVAVRLARQRAQAEPLEDWIFANQQTLTADGLKQAVKNIGGVADYEAKDAQVLEQVKADAALGKLLGVTATPTFFINGVKVSGGMQPQDLDAIIAHEIQKTQKSAQNQK